MIIKKVIDICKKRGAMFLYDTDEEQWISDGYAIYPMYHLPKFDEHSICKTYDISEKKSEKIHFKHEKQLPQNLSFADCTEEETICERGTLTLSYGGACIIPYQTSQGVVFVDAKYLAPVQDTNDVLLELYERYTEDKQLYFAVKSGFMLQALVLPYDVINDKFVADLHSIANQCEIALFNKQERKNKEND